MDFILHDLIILDRWWAKSKGGIPRMPCGSVVFPVSILKLLSRYLKKIWPGS
jgi:hypothetical protein